DLDALAAGTPGFTGADLANLVNEAALLAARHGKKVIEQDDLEEGIMRVIAGPEKKARLLSEKEQRITAYHEMGHALVGHFLENTNPIHKITIVSRGQALGLTISLPTEDRYMQTKQALLEEIAMTLGGRAAEELIFNEVTTGAANDLEKITSTAKQMVMRFGMSEKLGPRVLVTTATFRSSAGRLTNEPAYSAETEPEASTGECGREPAARATLPPPLRHGRRPRHARRLQRRRPLPAARRRGRRGPRDARRGRRDRRRRGRVDAARLRRRLARGGAT